MESDKPENSRAPVSSLSAAAIIRDLLLEDEEIARITGGKIFPVATDEARLPYIVYRRTTLEQDSVKGNPWNDTAGIEIFCISSTYEEGLELAERVRGELDGCRAELGRLRMRRCRLAGASEYWEADAYVQQLLFSTGIEMING